MPSSGSPQVGLLSLVLLISINSTGPLYFCAAHVSSVTVSLLSSLHSTVLTPYHHQYCLQIHAYVCIIDIDMQYIYDNLIGAKCHKCI